MEVEETQIPGSIGKSQDPVLADTVIDLTGDTDLKPKLMVTPYNTDPSPESLVYRRTILDKSYPVGNRERMQIEL